MFACCSRCSSSVLLRRLRDSSPCFVSAFSFLEYLPQPWFVTRRACWATFAKTKRIKRWCLSPMGIKKTNETSCECKVRCTALVTVVRAVALRATRTVVVIYAFFSRHFLFVLYWSMTSALHVCNKCCSVLYFWLGRVLLWMGVGDKPLELHKSKSCPPFLLSFEVIWFDHNKVNWKKKMELWNEKSRFVFVFHSLIVKIPLFSMQCYYKKHKVPCEHTLLPIIFVSKDSLFLYTSLGLYFFFFQLRISHTQNIYWYARLLSVAIHYNENKSHSCHFCRKYNSTTIHTFYTDLQFKQKSVWLDIITLAFISIF